MSSWIGSGDDPLQAVPARIEHPSLPPKMKTKVGGLQGRIRTRPLLSHRFSDLRVPITFQPSWQLFEPLWRTGHWPVSGTRDWKVP